MLPVTSLLRRVVVVVVLALAVAALDGCTSGVQDSPSADTPTPTTEPAPEPELRVVTRVTRIAGVLPARRREQLVERTRQTVSSYVTSALIEGEARPDFTGFTPGAKRLAERDRRSLTLTGLSDDATVEPKRVAAYLAVLASHRRAVGATARLEIDLRVTDGNTTRPVHLSGRLLLTPTPQGFQVFGYDLQRSGEGA